MRALRLRGEGQNALAAQKLRQVLEIDRGFVQAYSDLGWACLGTGDVEEAAAAFREAAVLDPWSFSDHMDLARVCRTQGKFVEAGRAYERAAELAPESSDAHLGAAACALEAGTPARALAHVESAMEVEGPSPRVLRLLGQVHEALGNFEQALAVYREWSKRNPDVPDGMLALAMAQSRRGEYDEARQVLVSVLAKWPREVAARRLLAYCLLKLGDADGAIQTYEQALVQEPDNWEAHRGLGVAYMVKARQTADERLQTLALKHWREALTIAPNQPRHEVLQRLIRESSTTRNPLQGLDY